MRRGGHERAAAAAAAAADQAAMMMLLRENEDSTIQTAALAEASKIDSQLEAAAHYGYSRADAIAKRVLEQGDVMIAAEETHALQQRAAAI